MKLAFSPS
ncbi:hypothetical protein LINPERPRIM_LOCUS11020 [Linum perenne]